MIGDQLELGLVIPVRDETSLAGMMITVRRQRRRLKTHAICVPPACATPLSRGSPNNCRPAQSCKMHFSTLLLNESEIILDNLFVLD